MNFRNVFFPAHGLGSIGNFVGLIFILSLLLLLTGSCAKEEPQEMKTPRVVMRIEKPAMKPAPPVPPKEAGAEPASQEKAEPPRGVETSESPAKAEASPATKVASHPLGGDETPPLPSVAQKKPERFSERTGGRNTYKVLKGESLAMVAGRKDVYGDPLKWSGLYRLNMDHLNAAGGSSADFCDRELPEGLDLTFLTLPQLKENVSNLSEKPWIVHVISSQDMNQVVEPAVKLIRNGYHVYLAKARVKGKDWIRLRVGFFKASSDAAEAGKKIEALLNISDLWVTKTTRNELERYGAY